MSDAFDDSFSGMEGVLFTVGLACVGMGLPLVATEQGTWDFVGVSLLVAGVVTLICSFLFWWQSNETVAAAAEPEAPSDVNIPLKRATANALTELDAIQRRLREAAKTRRLVTLPAYQYQPAADLLTEHGLVESRQILDDAYNACDNLQHRLDAPERNWDGGPIPEMIEPRIEEDDDLPAVLQRVEVAITELRQLQGKLPD
jgi:hypothetical protein